MLSAASNMPRKPHASAEITYVGFLHTRIRPTTTTLHTQTTKLRMTVDVYKYIYYIYICIYMYRFGSSTGERPVYSQHPRCLGTHFSHSGIPGLAPCAAQAQIQGEGPLVDRTAPRPTAGHQGPCTADEAPLLPSVPRVAPCDGQRA